VTAPTNPLSNSFPFWPLSFNQPILPGWTFGNIVVNENNSSAPATELAIVAEESYGRQIGKLVDAVVELIKQHGDRRPSMAFTDLLDLRKKVEEIKTQAAKASLQQIARDLQRLKDEDPPAYDKEVAALRLLLPP